MQDLSTEDLLIGILGLGITILAIPFFIAMFIFGIDIITEAWKLLLI
mgnify:CR=1 FL=1